MMQLHQFFRSPSGKIVFGLLLVSALALGGWTVRQWCRNSAYGEASRDCIFVCAQTGKSFHYRLESGTEIPVPSPFSGQNTGYLAELCYWTADGHIKDDPTPVLLNSAMNQPPPTFCPDCRRLVVGRNPRPQPGSPPPPTQEEFHRRVLR